MNRITDKMLENLAALVNKELGTPTAAYTRDADGRLTANVGNYHVYQCMGVCELVRMSNVDGGISVAVRATTKSELFERMHAFLAGFRAANEMKVTA